MQEKYCEKVSHLRIYHPCEQPDRFKNKK